MSSLRLGALLQYEREYLSIKDPANVEAVEWAKRNRILFPTDTCTFHNDPPIRQYRDVNLPSFTPLMDDLPPLMDDLPDQGPLEDAEPAVIWKDL